jgi:uncharacterized protein (DUF1697 family)
MVDLKEVLNGIGLFNVETYIQSGNVVFDAKVSNLKELENQVKELIASKFGFDVPVIIREKDNFLQVIDSNSYKIDDDSLKRFHMIFLNEEPTKENANLLKSFIPEDEELAFIEQDLILKCGERYSQAKLNNGFIEKKLKVAATTRNWKTVLKLKEMVCRREAYRLLCHLYSTLVNQSSN